MKTFGMAALALVAFGWAGAASAQSWYYDDPYPRRWGYERDYYGGWDRRGYDRYDRGYDWDRRGPARPPRAHRQGRGRGPAAVPSTRAGNCYTAPPRPHAAPRVICRY
jgi:hypothetical protein